MINLKKIQGVVMAHPNPMNPMLAKWLMAIGVGWRKGSSDYGSDLARNQEVYRFLNEDVPKGKNWLLMIDHDIVPVTESNQLVGTQTPLAFAATVTKAVGGGGHTKDGSFGAAFYKVHKDVLIAMGDAPWFKTTFNETLTQRLKCQCSYFGQKAKEAGYEAKVVGHAGHQQGGQNGIILLPSSSSKKGYAGVWPHEVPGYDN